MNGTTWSIDDLIVNLKSIASSQVNERLCVANDGKYLLRDERYLQPVMRLITGDSRSKIVDYVERVLIDIKKHLSHSNEWKHEKIKQLLPQVLGGLENIKTTYRADRVILYRLENIIDTLRHQCDDDSTTAT